MTELRFDFLVLTCSWEGSEIAHDCSVVTSRHPTLPEEKKLLTEQLLSSDNRVTPSVVMV